MRYTPHGPKDPAVQRNTLINTMIHPDDTNNQTNSNSTNGLRIPTTSGRIRERGIEIVCTLYRCSTDEAAEHGHVAGAEQRHDARSHARQHFARAALHHARHASHAQRLDQFDPTHRPECRGR